LFMSIPELLQTYGPAVGVAAGVFSIAGFFFQLYRASHRKHLAMLNDRIAVLESEKADLIAGASQPTDEHLIAVLQKDLDATQAAAGIMTAELAASAQAIAHKEQAATDLTADLEKTRDDLLALGQELKSRNNKIRHALELEGRLWETKTLKGVPAFRSLQERRTAILSILNLKGGVGKTTITAHLASALSQRGYRVLVVDLDLQGSLSSLFIPNDIIAQRSKDGALLQDYLTSASAGQKTNLLDYAVPILDGGSAVVATTDRLAYAELNLTMQWLLRVCKRDTRFLLRRGLHQRRVAKRFDVVLLDCPPLINTCCVNALAASDYVIIPVTPSRKAADRAPQLLYTLKKLCAVINPDLLVAGLLANRTHGVQLTQKEQYLWDNLLVQCKDQWEEPVNSFKTVIRQSPEIATSENDFRPAEEGGDLYRMFHGLAKELEERMPGECRRTTTAHS
jgi:cellulose biosynthesis protein BcsQ